MSAWDMNDGSALTGTHTFTNGSAVVNGNASAVYLTEVKVGDVVTSAGGESLRVSDQHPARTVATSGVNTSSNVITFTAHGYLDGTAVTYNAGGGTALGGLVDGTIYYVRDKADDTFKLAATSGGSAISLTGTGNNAQNFVGSTNTGLTMTSNMSGSTESGVAAAVSRPPIDFATSSAGQINSNILGITNAESLGGLDNITDIAIVEDGARYVQAPTVTIPVPTVRTIATAKVTTGTDSIEIASHNMRTGTEVKYQDGGGTALAGLTDNTSYFVIRTDEDNIKLAANLSNAQAGTAINLTGTGNNAQTLEGIQATATATISGGKVTGITVTNVGSDYQTLPSITVAAPGGTGNLDLTDGAVNIVADDEIVIPSALYAVLTTGDAMTYAQGGSGNHADLTDGTVYFAIKSGTANKMSLATTYANAIAGTKVTLNAVAAGGTAHSFTGATAAVTAVRGLGDSGDNDSREVAHIGWVKKTVGTGGRAGRVHYETLVAASSITGDAEDIATPDS